MTIIEALNNLHPFVLTMIGLLVAVLIITGPILYSDWKYGKHKKTK